MSRKQRTGNKLFNVGFSDVRKKLEKRSKYYMDCRSCRFFEQQEGDKYEVCQNKNVTKYDMVHTEVNCYCTFWQPEGKKDEETTPMTMEEYIEHKFGKTLQREVRRIRNDY